MQTTLSDTDIDALLSSQVIGHLGCSESSKPYVFPIAYLYKDNAIYGQTTEGKKVEILEKNPKVCFQVEEVTDDGWKSAMVWGYYEDFDFSKPQSATVAAAAQLLALKLGVKQSAYGVHIPYTMGETLEPLMVNGKRATLFRIVIEEKSGRMLRKE